MKKLLILVLAVVMLCSVSVTAFAADLDEDNKVGTVTVSYGVAEGYVVTIPTDVIVSTAGVEASLSASSVLIPDGKTLTVSVTSANNFTLAYAGKNIGTAQISGSGNRRASRTSADHFRFQVVDRHSFSPSFRPSAFCFFLAKRKWVSQKKRYP